MHQSASQWLRQEQESTETKTKRRKQSENLAVAKQISSSGTSSHHFFYLKGNKIALKVFFGRATCFHFVSDRLWGKILWNVSFADGYWRWIQRLTDEMFRLLRHINDLCPSAQMNKLIQWKTNLFTSKWTCCANTPQPPFLVKCSIAC